MDYPLTSAAAIVVVVAAAMLGEQFAASARAGAVPIESPQAGGSLTIKAGLFDWLFGGGTGEEQQEPRRRRFERATPRDDRSDEERTPERHKDREEATFKTYCVRLCDGFYFPISSSVHRQGFADDTKRCEQSCPSRSRLFTLRIPRDDKAEMVDLQGHPYRDLPTAFQHLTRYDASCTCRGNPWDEEALARHRAYAQEAEHNAVNQVAEQPSAPAVKPQSRASRQKVWGYRAERRTRRDRDSDD